MYIIISCCDLGLCSDPSQATRGRPPKQKHRDLDSVAKDPVAKWPRGRPPKKRKVSQQIVSDLPSAPPAPIPQGMPFALLWRICLIPSSCEMRQRKTSKVEVGSKAACQHQSYTGWWAYYWHPDPGTTKHSTQLAMWGAARASTTNISMGATVGFRCTPASCDVQARDRW